MRALPGGLGKEARYEVASFPGALRRGPRPEWNDEQAGSLVTPNSSTGNLGVLTFADLLARRVTETNHISAHRRTKMLHGFHNRCNRCEKRVVLDERATSQKAGRAEPE